MACGSCGGQRRSTSRVASSDTVTARAAAVARAADAGSSTMYEVVTSRGQATGRRFTSLVAATGYARRIGGSTRPVVD